MGILPNSRPNLTPSSDQVTPHKVLAAMLRMLIRARGGRPCRKDVKRAQKINRCLARANKAACRPSYSEIRRASIPSRSLSVKRHERNPHDTVRKVEADGETSKPTTVTRPAESDPFRWMDEWHKDFPFNS